MRYHKQVRSELNRVAGIFLDMPSVWRERIYNGMRGELLATKVRAVLLEPVPVRILGHDPTDDFWTDVLIRDTIERAWRKDEPLFFRKIKEG